VCGWWGVVVVVVVVWVLVVGLVVVVVLVLVLVLVMVLVLVLVMVMVMVLCDILSNRKVVEHRSMFFESFLKDSHHIIQVSHRQLNQNQMMPYYINTTLYIVII
jgi:hypothetical protein